MVRMREANEITHNKYKEVIWNYECVPKTMLHPNLQNLFSAGSDAIDLLCMYRQCYVCELPKL